MPLDRPISSAHLPGCKYHTLEHGRIHLQDRGTGPNLLCLHGMGTSHYSWRYNTPFFEKNFRVIAPDLPGYGFSETGSEFGYHIDDYVQIILELLKELGVKRTHLIAHSFGGAIAERLIRFQPDIIDRVVLVGAADLEQPTLDHNPEMSKNPLLNSYYDKSVIDFPLIQLSKLFNKNGRTLETSRKVSKVNHSGIKRNGAPSLANPVLIIWGRNDLIIPLDRSNRLLNHWKNQDMVVLDGAGHACHEEKPTVFNRLVEGFLSEQTDPANPVQ